MPAISLVVCLYQQRDLLARLIRESAGCYDDLVVVHDGPDTTDVRSVVEAAGGRFFERPRENQQEPHWPFAWGQARHDWILRLDADEFPSTEMKAWLLEFRRAPAPPADISGYTCIWPMWDGQKVISKKWPVGRIFLFHKQRVRFFGMAEQAVVPDDKFHTLDLVLHHQPNRNPGGLHNILIRKQAYRWRQCIAQSLMGKPTDLPCWRWTKDSWPCEWEQIRQHPFETAARRLIIGTLRTMRQQWRTEKRFFPVVAAAVPINHAMICLKFWGMRRKFFRDNKN